MIWIQYNTCGSKVLLSNIVVSVARVDRSSDRSLRSSVSNLGTSPDQYFYANIVAVRNDLVYIHKPVSPPRNRDTLCLKSQFRQIFVKSYDFFYTT